MPLKKLQFKPGVNRENTRYTNEGGYYESDKIRFRQGTPEKIGGWIRTSAQTFLGICRSLWTWVTLTSQKLTAVGTNLKFYVNTVAGSYYDITPIRDNETLTNPFTTNVTTGTANKILVTDADHGAINGDYVEFFFSTSASYTLPAPNAAITISGQYQIEFIDINSYYITVNANASSAVSNLGGTVYAVYQLNTGPAVQVANQGWGAGGWGLGYWGVGEETTDSLRVWVQSNWGQDLLFGPSGGGLYYWNATIGYNNSLITYGASTPCIIVTTIDFLTNTAIELTTTGNLPAPLVPGKTYYTRRKDDDESWLCLDTTIVSMTATCSGAGTNTLNVTSVESGTLVAGMTVYYISSGTSTSLGTLTLTGTGTGGTGTYTVSAGASVASTDMYASTLINTTTAASGSSYISSRGIAVSSLSTAVSVPTYQNYFLISDQSNYVIVFGTNDYFSTTLDPMLIRWSTFNSYSDWTLSDTGTAGSKRLSHGSQIITAMQSRQEIVIWTDSSLYSMQLSGSTWLFQLLADNISIAGINAAALASGVIYWMGVDKFYKYDGRVQALNCDLRQWVFETINKDQFQQVFASTNEGFNEIWWFYCDGESTQVTNYVIYNYVEDVWYYGTMGRTAWLDSGLNQYPLAATYSQNLVWHENGVDDCTDSTEGVAIDSYILTSEFDIDDGNNFGFVWRVVPDMKFSGSTPGTNPYVTMTLLPMQNSGSGYNQPTSVGGSSYAYVTSPGNQTISVDGKNYIIEQFTGQIYTRVRGRQMALSVRSNEKGVQWQLGAPRIDIRQDGRR